MKQFILALILLVVFTAAFRFFRAGSRVDKNTPELEVEAILAAAGVSYTEEHRRLVDSYLELHSSQGYMSLYREIYRISMDRQRYEFSRQLTAVSVLLILSHIVEDPGPMHGSGKRLFIHFSRRSVVDLLFAVEMTKMDKKFDLFHLDQVLHELWQEYLRHVWERSVLPQMLRQEKMSPDQMEFLQLLPEFRQQYHEKRREALARSADMDNKKKDEVDEADEADEAEN